MKCNDMNLYNVPQVITACCILHNMSEVYGELFNDDWLDVCTMHIT